MVIYFVVTNNGKLCFGIMKDNFFVILGNQLFDPKYLKDQGCNEVFMAEDYGLCTYVNHHKLKIYLFLTAMREYRDELNKKEIKVNYFDLESRKDKKDYFDLLISFLKKRKIDKIQIFELEDKPFEKKLNPQCLFLKEKSLMRWQKEKKFIEWHLFTKKREGT